MLVLPVLSKNPTEFQVPLTGIIHQFVTAEIRDHGVEPYFKPFFEHGKIPAFQPFGFIGMPSRKLSGEALIETLLENRPCLIGSSVFRDQIHLCSKKLDPAKT